MAAQKKYIPPVFFHPGVTLSEKLTEMGMTAKEFSVRTSKPEKTIFAIIGGRSSITPDMAVAFENVTRIPASLWMSKQTAYDEYKARVRNEGQLKSACEWARMFPFADMAHYGWVENVKDMTSRVKILLSFFQISGVKAWEDYYINGQLKVAFRISLSGSKDPHSLSAWLREGELQSAGMNAAAFSEAKLREAIPLMRELAEEQPQGYSSRLRELCSNIGIKLVYTPCLPKAPISGATRWIKDTPCIQLTGRHKRSDVFWFTFFHELGHILLHGKRNVFLEDSGISGIDEVIEREADDYASKILFPKEKESEIISSGDFSKQSILAFAGRFRVHPGIIVGRLQHDNIIPFGRHKDLIPSLDLFGD